MRSRPIHDVIEHLRRAALLPDGTGLGDGDLLGRFIESRDEAGFAVLVKRHGPMVWGVCRRLLSHHEAEEAFQATFLVLARKAASIRSRRLVGNWLYGVAHQTALLARRTAARRRAREVQVPVMPDIVAVPHDPWLDFRPVLDDELSRLPEIYRVVIVLCELEGRSRKEVAGQLGVPEGTVAGRLARAREMLAKRLVRRGVTLSAGALATNLSQSAASAGVPSAVVLSKSIAIVSLQATTGAIPVTVAALTEGVLKTMALSKLKLIVGTLMLVAGLVGGGVAVGLGQSPDSPKPKKADPEPKPAHAKEEPAKREVPALAKEIVKIQVLRRANEKGEVVPLTREMIEASKKTIEDQEKIGELLAFFPQVGTDKKPDATLPGDGRRLYGAAYQITLHREKGDPLYITISSDRDFWCWSQGKAQSNGDWHLKNAKEVCQFLDDLLKKDEPKKEKPALTGKVIKVEVSGAVEGKRTKKTIEDEKTIAELLALFPEVGTREEYKIARGSASLSDTITLHFEKGEPISIRIHRRNNDWLWLQRDAEGRTELYGLWGLNKDVPKFLDELLK